MAKPKIADEKPMIVDLEPGAFWWCACGRSEKQPYCDGSHKGTGITPVRFEIHNRRKAAVCMCKHTENAPYCDGAHSEIDLMPS